MGTSRRLQSDGSMPLISQEYAPNSPISQRPCTNSSGSWVDAGEAGICHLFVHAWVVLASYTTEGNILRSMAWFHCVAA
jgi:hypothetical protein